MRFAAMLLLLTATTMSAQTDVARTEFFAGYSYLHGIGTSQALNGFETSLAVNLNNHVAAEGSISGHYARVNINNFDFNSSTGINEYEFLAGPRLKVRPVFVHALAGIGHTIGASNASSPLFGDVSAVGSATSFAAAFGGGLQVKVSPQWAVRTGADYLLTWYASTAASSVRVSAGLVYSFGMRETATSRRSQTPGVQLPPPTAPACGTLWNCTGEKKN